MWKDWTFLNPDIINHDKLLHWVGFHYQIQHWFNQKYYLIIFHFSHVGRGVVFILLCCFVYQSDFSNLHVYIIEEPFLYFENTTAVPIKPKYAHVLWNEKNKTSSKIYKSRVFWVFLNSYFSYLFKKVVFVSKLDYSSFG